MFEEHARRPREDGEQAGHQEARRPGRHEEPGIPQQAKIGTADRTRIHRTGVGPIGFTDEHRIGQQGAAREHRHEDEFRSPAQEMIERAADQW